MLFGLANAGVVVSAFGDATWLVLAGLMLGKPVGVWLFGMVAAKTLKFGMPTGMDGTGPVHRRRNCRDRIHRLALRCHRRLPARCRPAGSQDGRPDFVRHGRRIHHPRTHAGNPAPVLRSGLSAPSPFPAWRGAGSTQNIRRKDPLGRTGPALQRSGDARMGLAVGT